MSEDKWESTVVNKRVFRTNLPFFIKCHDNEGSSIPTDEVGPLQELSLPFFQTQAVHNALPLTALQTRFNDGKVRGVDAQRYLSDHKQNVD